MSNELPLTIAELLRVATNISNAPESETIAIKTKDMDGEGFKVTKVYDHGDTVHVIIDHTQYDRMAEVIGSIEHIIRTYQRTMSDAAPELQKVIDEIDELVCSIDQ